MTSCSIRYFGGTTALLTSDGVSFLTDPHLSEHRVERAAIESVTAVLISSTHPAHFHRRSLKFIPTHWPIVVPSGALGRMARLTPNPVIELKNWSSHRFGDRASVTAVPIQRHQTIHWRLERIRAAAYVVMIGQRTIYFAGYSRYGTHFSEGGRIFKCEAALLPIRPAYAWDWTNQALTAEEAVLACHDLGTRHLIPLPADGSARIRMENEISRRRLALTIHSLKFGESFELNPD